MTDVEYLTLEEVLAIHADQIDRYGGTAGIRDIRLLESALAMPRMKFGDAYLHPTLPEMAAAYLFHLVQSHPFVDGNKRVGLAAALAFLGLNRQWLAWSEELEDEVVELVPRIARGEAGKPDAAIFLRERSIAFSRTRR